MIAPKPKAKTVEEFIQAAPDAAPSLKVKKPRAPKGHRTPMLKGQREQISVTVPAGTVDRIDAAASKLGMTRAGFINQAISRALAGEEK